MKAAAAWKDTQRKVDTWSVPQVGIKPDPQLKFRRINGRR